MECASGWLDDPGRVGSCEDGCDEDAPNRGQPGEQPSEDTMGHLAAARQTAADQFMEAPMLKTNDLSRSLTSPLSSKATPSLRLSR